MNIKDYIFIARPDHWFKNVFVLPGIIIAVYLTDAPLNELAIPFLIAILSVCLVASSNYTINEWLDAEFDKFHPIKSSRPSVLGKVTALGVYFQYIILVIIGLGLAWFVSKPFFITSIILLVMGVVYNVKPFRTKDLPFLDVLSESINNPLRLYLGWFIVTSTVFPPSSLVLAYWMAGAFLMAVKRYAELNFLGEKNVAALYRKSFKFYSSERLMSSILFYAMAFSFFFGVFLIKHKIELILSLPLFFGLFCWYLILGMDPSSAAKSPEKLYRNKKLLAFMALIVLVCVLLLFVNVAELNYFLENNFSK